MQAAPVRAEQGREEAEPGRQRHDRPRKSSLEGATEIESLARLGRDDRGEGEASGGTASPGLTGSSSQAVCGTRLSSGPDAKWIMLGHLTLQTQAA